MFRTNLFLAMVAAVMAAIIAWREVSWHRSGDFRDRERPAPGVSKETAGSEGYQPRAVPGKSNGIPSVTNDKVIQEDPQDFDELLAQGKDGIVKAWNIYRQLQCEDSSAAAEWASRLQRVDVRGLVPDLVRSLRDPDSQTRATAVRLLGTRFFAEATRALVSGYDAESDVIVKTAYLRSFGKYADDRDVLDRLCGGLMLSASSPQGQAVQTLSLYGKVDVARSAIREGLTIVTGDIRRQNLITGLGGLVLRGDEDSVPDLVEIARHGKDAREQRLAFLLLQTANRLSALTEKEIAALEKMK